VGTKGQSIMQTRKGFTLLELLIVVVILGVLALIAAPSLLNAADQAKQSAVKANVSAAASSVTSRFALNTTDKATVVASDVVTDLNTDNKNPMVEANAAFATAGNADGSVVLAGNDANDLIVITGYGKDGSTLIKKTVKAPASN